MKRAREHDIQNMLETSQKYIKSAATWLNCNRFGKGSLPDKMPLGPARIIGRKIYDEGICIENQAKDLQDLILVRVFASYTYDRSSLDIADELGNTPNDAFDAPFSKGFCEGGMSMDSYIDYLIDYNLDENLFKDQLVEMMDSVIAAMDTVPHSGNANSDAGYGNPGLDVCMFKKDANYPDHSMDSGCSEILYNITADEIFEIYQILNDLNDQERDVGFGIVCWTHITT